MKYSFTLLLCAVFLNASPQDIPAINKGKFRLPAGVTSKDYLPNTLIIKFAKEGSVVIKGTDITSGQSKLSLKSVLISGMKPLFKKETLQAKFPQQQTNIRDDAGLERVYEVKFSGSKAIEEVINEVLGNKNVVYAEPSYIYYTGYIPNDSFFVGNQTYLNQVRAPRAWDILKNSSGVIIGIVDSGTDLDHEDLADNIYINTADPVNGMDDDNDGYVDNNMGWDFVGQSASNLTEDNNPEVTSDTTDHGVHVSGIAGAVSDNGKGVSSVAFNPKLLIVKVGSDDNSTAIYRGYEGIKYAADHGAQVINCSWGGPGGGSYGQDIINYAIQKGCLVVAAAGNDDTDVADYPAAYDGVLSVANVRSTDVKSSSSNYNFKVDISAPGNGIYNTVNGSRYASYSGTSMSSPMVAGAAALVKSRFPDLDMLQIGEQLRVTADQIDNKNTAYAGRLGKGRMNVFRALTESQPSVRNQKLTVIDKGNGSIPAADTIQLYFDLKNFLAPATGLVVTLSSTNGDAQLITSQVNVGTVATSETKLMVGPFKVFIRPGISDNEEIEFKVTYASNGNNYTDTEYFKITASLDYRNINVNQITTTITSNGRVGFNNSNAENGLGFTYKSRSLLFEAALMIGNTASNVSNNARTGDGDSDSHFIKRIRVKEVENEDVAFEGRSEFDDSGNPNRLNVYVKHRQLAFSEAPDDKYVIVEYEIENKNTTPLNGVYIGLFTDWDVDQEGRDATKYDVVNRMGYTFGKAGGTPYAAVKLLSITADPLYYPMSYQVDGDLLQNGTFTIAEKYQTLSGGIKALSLGEDAPNGYDVMFVSGSGPYMIPANGIIKVAFAFIGGDDLADIEASAGASQRKYDLINNLKPILPAGAEFILKQNYPNPAVGSTTIEFSIPEQAVTSLNLYNIMGQKVRSIMNEDLVEGTYRLPGLSLVRCIRLRQRTRLADICSYLKN